MKQLTQIGYLAVRLMGRVSEGGSKRRVRRGEKKEGKGVDEIRERDVPPLFKLFLEVAKWYLYFHTYTYV